MRLTDFGFRSIGPIQFVSVSELSNVVVLAGPNGVGKTSINNALLSLAREPTPDPNRWMVVSATNDEEQSKWGRDSLDTRQAPEASQLRAHLQRNQRRNRYQSSFLNFDSDRAIRNVQNYGFSWNIGDPFAEDIGWDIGFQSLQTRYNDVRHSLFRLVEAQRREISDEVLRLQKAGAAGMLLNYPDVLKPFKDAFSQLLAPKKMLEVSAQDQQLYYEHNDLKLSFDSLSSGEREVINIVFDFLLRDPQHCVVVFDEPELHLHPELSYKMLQTLSRIGQLNQFVFSTHSPEIISASLENTVVFVAPPRGPDQNQAIIVHRDDQTHHALQALGQSIGVISLGKKLVLVEGEESSLDKQTYGAILQNDFPEFILVPVGGKDTIRSFDDIRENILDKTIWGVDFFLLCDRDAINSLGPKGLAKERSPRIKRLPRYHVENYFLDENVLAKVFRTMEGPDHWLCNPASIQQRLREIAESMVPYAASLNIAAIVRESVGNVSILPKGVSNAQSDAELTAMFTERVSAERSRVSDGLNPQDVGALVAADYSRLMTAVRSDDPQWRIEIPGRVVLNKFAASAGIQVGRLKQLYLANADKRTTFADIFAIFESFRQGN